MEDFSDSELLVAFDDDPKANKKWTFDLVALSTSVLIGIGSQHMK